MKYLVTGGAGFIGSHVVDALVGDGHDVLVVDNFFSGRKKNLNNALSSGRVEVVEADVSDEGFWKSQDAVDGLFHFAAQTSVTASVEDADKDFRWNVLSAKNIFDWIKRKQVRKLVYANTAGALYGFAEKLPTDETSLIAPVCPYGATKGFFEVYLSSLTHSLYGSERWSSDPAQDNYFSWVSLRLANVYGARQVTRGEAGVVPIFIEKFKKKEPPIIFGSQEISRDYVNVFDVARAFFMASKKLDEGPLNTGINIASGMETTTGTVFMGIKEAMIEFGVQGLTDITPNVEALRPGEVERSCLGIDRARQMIGWQPEKDFASALKSTVEHYLNEE